MEALLAGQLDRITKKADVPKRRGQDGLDEIDRDGLAFANKKKTPRTHCTVDEAFVIQRMIKKHGEDYAKMHKDYKLNKFIWTENFIGKKAKEFQNKYPNGV